MTSVDQLLPHVPYQIYFDNLFTSVELLHDLKERGVETTGTIRGNRVKNCTLSSVDKMIKENRRSYEVCSDSASGISIVRNKGKGLACLNLTYYTPTILIYISEQNAWDLYKHNKEPIDHLTFRRGIVTAILESHKIVTISRRRPSKRAKLHSRFDGGEHYVTELPTDDVTKKKKQLKSRSCHKKTTTMCLF
ncbi:piggyBac transposable element-derived protein 2-like [Schistocerca gregaria]|uniref:piggyBac transposable element-derived protein 2-like n=1 Tax=Schistocerca gregaria TaxID=7010 RepID=UPI00211F13F6|nr:piggyBac transposable element-derived protein 2-like [Schistocerca gregaria]